MGIADRETFFTIRTGQQGFTDQLMQFNAFYKLGLSLGYRYVFTPFFSRRSLPRAGEEQDQSAALHDERRVSDTPSKKQSDIYDFLGFNQLFQSERFQLPGSGYPQVEVELSDRILAEHGASSLEALKAYVAARVRSGTEAVDTGDERVLVILRLERKPPPQGKGKRKFFSLIHEGVPAFPDGLDLRKQYFCTRRSEEIPRAFESGKLKILLHMRQGDTSVVETPWGTLIPVDSRRPDFMTEQDGYAVVKAAFSNNAVDSLFTPADYFHFAQRLLSNIDTSNLSMLSFSDGFQRAFDVIEHQVDRLNLSSGKLQSLRDARPGYDAKQFSLFGDIANNTCVIGETQAKLHQLIHAALTADLVIVAAQQRMLLKLIASYGGGPAPIVIVLYRNQVPDNSDVIRHHRQRFLYINVDNPDLTKAVELINPLLSRQVPVEDGNDGLRDA